ncbi:MAG: bifunctional DNA-formamidopyrimidine glycosylase/DNA-(apurinic or apyrimidinic site) lyase [Bryobacterales bacterium]|nr:bifunctional DNA-formamidopyrimidine glycosylase/DNA-(apurinic or apyrimidinic site) lyase [Bryobacterales bacterium]
MPELPEVETVVRDLRPVLPGRRIEAIRVHSALVAGRDLEEVSGSVRAVRRHGKYILLDCDSGSLTIHLGMTGKLLLQGERGPHTRVEFFLDRGGMLLYDDIRMFGKMFWSVDVHPRVACLGPDALAVEAQNFLAGLKARHRQLKPLLLDQGFVAGLGNIYVDEILFRAGLHPCAVASELRRGRAVQLYETMRATLAEAIDARGSSISDYVDASNRRGSFQLSHRVYGKAGQPCPRCGSPIVRIVLAQRGTHLCPRCQKPS